MWTGVVEVSNAGRADASTAYPWTYEGDDGKRAGGGGRTKETWAMTRIGESE
jgi:hypothetical protein